MRLFCKAGLAALAAAALLGVQGCEDELPTATGADRFPEGSLPTTVEVLLPAERFLTGAVVFDGFADPRAAPYLLAAHEFDGVLEAHALARLTGFPDSVTYGAGAEARSDTAFTFAAGRVVTVVDASASAAPRPAVLRLYELDQPFDSAAVGWTAAAPGVPWRTPGGTPGRLLGEAVWTPGDTVARDTLVWQIDSLAVARLARDGAAGLLVTSETAGSRVQFSRLQLQTALRPASRPDTAVARTVSAGLQTFVFTPPPPAPPGVYRVGGVTGARTVLELDLAQRVPGCASPATTPGCPTLPLRDVTLNQAVLVLDPLPVPAGFGPLSDPVLVARRVVETELGRLAPLAEALQVDTISAAVFRVNGQSVALNLTTAVNRLVRADSAAVPARTTIALLGQPATGQFGYAWFAGSPRLRLVYTLPLRPQLP